MKKQLTVVKVRIAPDSRDASKDYFITSEEASRLFSEGKLARDLTNSTFGKLVYIPIKR